MAGILPDVSHSNSCSFLFWTFAESGLNEIVVRHGASNRDENNRPDPERRTTWGRIMAGSVATEDSVIETLGLEECWTIESAAIAKSCRYHGALKGRSRSRKLIKQSRDQRLGDSSSRECLQSFYFKRALAISNFTCSALT